MFNKFDNKKGMTIIETLMAMAAFLLLIVGVMALMVWGNHGKDVIFEQLKTQNEGRKVVQEFLSNIRRATYSSVGAYPVQTAESQQIIFYTDTNLNALRERVRYFLDSRTLKRGIIIPAGNPLTYNSVNETIEEIAHDVANTTTPVFYYYNQNYTGVTDIPLTYPINIPDVKMVGIKLMLDEKPNVTPAPFSIEAKTAIRNLKTN